jgi:hypothetical protein
MLFAPMLVLAAATAAEGQSCAKDATVTPSCPAASSSSCRPTQAQRARKPCTDATSPSREETEAEIAHLLGQRISVDFKDQPLKQAVNDLRNVTGLNLVLDLPALEAESIDLDRPITMHLDNVTVKAVLNLVLHHAHLAYVIQDDVVRVTTKTRARGKLVVNTFPVDDLVSPTLSLQQLFDAICRRESVIREVDLIELITTTIDPETWAKQGGQGTIEYYPLDKTLVVHQTPDIQEQVAELLAAMRRLMKEKPPHVEAPVPCGFPALCTTEPTASVTTSCPPNDRYVIAATVPPSEPAGSASPPGTMRAAVEDGQERIEMQCPGGIMSCDGLAFNVPGSGRTQTRLFAKDRQIQIRNPYFKASADRALKTGPGQQMVLEGHVRVKYLAGTNAEVVAERIVLGLADGRLEIQPAVTNEKATKEAQQVFQFWSFR